MRFDKIHCEQRVIIVLNLFLPEMQTGDIRFVCQLVFKTCYLRNVFGKDGKQLKKSKDLLL
jgi:hypothetical protein